MYRSARLVLSSHRTLEVGSHSDRLERGAKRSTGDRIHAPHILTEPFFRLEEAYSAGMWFYDELSKREYVKTRFPA